MLYPNAYSKGGFDEVEVYWYGHDFLYGPCHEKTCFLHRLKQRRRNLKFQSSSHLMWLRVQPGLCRARSENSKTGFLFSFLMSVYHMSVIFGDQMTARDCG